MSTQKNFLSPAGRIVYGSLYEAMTKDFDGKPLVIKTGPQAGQPTQRYQFGLAIAKEPGHTHWSQTKWGAEIWALGHQLFPQAAQRDDFAWKITDGDSSKPNKRNRIPNQREGFPGHWVVQFSSSFAPRIYNRDGSAAIPEPGAVKCGYYVQVAGTIDGNGNQNNPGVYINHNMVALQGYGPEIVSGPDPTAVGFGQGAAPAGMQSAPAAGMTAAPVAAAPPPPAAPAPAAAPPPPVPVQAHTAILQTPAAPAAPVAAPPPPAVPATPAMSATAIAAGYTYATLKGAGWTDDQMRQAGYLA